MLLPISPITAPTSRTSGTVLGNAGGSVGTSFASELQSAIAQPEQSATQQETSFASGGGANIAQTMAIASEATLVAEEFSLLISKAMSAYQSVTNMQV